MADWYKINRILVWQNWEEKQIYPAVIPIINRATQWPCPDWFHVPLWSDWATLRSTMSSLSSNNASWYINKLHMPLAWLRSSAAWALTNQWVTWYYDCASASTSYNWWRRYLYINSSNWVLNYDEYRATGMTIRPFKNEFVEPDSTWTAIQWTVWGNGIFWHSWLWLISIIYSSNKITIADKNLWATTVYNNWNALSQSNCWTYHQWWNNYWFAWTGSISTSWTKVNASNYWPWNYYSSGTFIYSNSWAPNDWSTVQNDNLRWWVTWNVPVS